MCIVKLHKVVEKIQLSPNLFCQEYLSPKSISKDISGSGNNDWRDTLGQEVFWLILLQAYLFLGGWVDGWISK